MLFHETGKIAEAAAAMKERLGGPVEAAAILGSGFAPLLDLLSGPRRLSYLEVDGLGPCSAPGHAGEIVAGSVGGARWAFFSGRFHLYEGRSAGEIALPVGLAQALGADRVLLTCAAGATTGVRSPGDLVLVEDHLNLTGANPLLTVPSENRSPAFLSMGDAYDRAALSLAESVLAGGGRRPSRGVLASLPGPSFETPAEYAALARLGADLVSMSLVLETIAARSLGLRVLALAVVANGPARLGEKGADGENVLRTVEEAVRGRRRDIGSLLCRFAELR